MAPAVLKFVLVKVICRYVLHGDLKEKTPSQPYIKDQHDADVEYVVVREREWKSRGRNICQHSDRCDEKCWYGAARRTNQQGRWTWHSCVVYLAWPVVRREATASACWKELLSSSRNLLQIFTVGGRKDLALRQPDSSHKIHHTFLNLSSFQTTLNLYPPFINEITLSKIVGHLQCQCMDFTTRSGERRAVI